MTDRPNIFIFMTDQQRGATVLPDSPVKAKTPWVDRLRQQGVTFSQTYCPSPHCCPSRATLMSGLYPSRHDVWNNVEVSNALTRTLAPGVRLWSEDMHDAGYDLYWSGKWHVSAFDAPDRKGWRTQYVGHHRSVDRVRTKREFVDQEWRTYATMTPPPDSPPPGEIVRPGYKRYTHYGVGENRNDRNIVEDGLGEIERRAEDGAGPPWCQVVSVNAPHDTYHPPQEFLDLYDLEEIELPANFDDPMEDKPALYRRTRGRFDQLSRDEHRDAIRHYLAYCSFTDDLFGRCWQALERTGQLENTIVIYLSDHGDYLGEHGLWCKGLPCFHSAYHVPLVMAGPGIEQPGRTVDAFVSLADLAPTFCDLAKCRDESREYTGASLVPFLRGGAVPEDWRDAHFTQSNGNELYGIQRAVFTRDWHFTYNGFDFDELYDLRNDPGQTVNLAGNPEYRDVREEMYRRLWKFARDQEDDCVNQYIMVALAEFGPGIVLDE